MWKRQIDVFIFHQPKNKFEHKVCSHCENWWTFLFSTTKTWLLVSITKVWYYSGPFLWHHPHLNIQHIWADVTMCVLMTPSAAQAPNYGISSKCWDVSVDDRPNLHVPGTGYKTDGNLIDDVTNVTLGAVPHAQVHNLNAKSTLIII